MKRNKFSLMFLFILLLCLTINLGFSSWTYMNEISNINTVNDDECTITIHTRCYSNNVNITVTDNYKSAVTEGSAFAEPSLSNTTYSPYKEGYVVPNSKTTVGSNTVISDDKTVETITTTYKEKRVKNAHKGSWTLSGNKYTYDVIYWVWTVVTTKTKEAPIDDVSSKVIKVQRGQIIKPFELNIDNYCNYGFYKDSNYSSLFDFSKPITSDCDIYLKYVEGSSQLTGIINGLSSGSYIIYDSNRGSSSSNSNSFNLFDDNTYVSSSRFAYLDEATLSSGTTLQLVYNDSKIVQDPSTGSITDDNAGDHRDNSGNIALDYYGNAYVGDKYCHTKIVLNGDFTVNGTLEIGAKVGSVNSNSRISFIIGNYAQIDLAGHDLIIDGGNVNCYGSIVDSIGGGKIIVKNGGTIMGMLVITDPKGGNQMAYGYGRRQAPFNEYKLAYIEVPIYAYNGTTIKGYAKMDLGSLGLSNCYLNILGSSSSASIFSWSSNNNENDYICLKPYIVTSLYPTNDVSSQASNNIYLDMFYQRFSFIINANITLNSTIPLNAEISIKKGITITKSIDLDLARIGVPLSPFFDVLLKENFELILKSKLILYPGSSFMTEPNSNLILDPGEVKTYKDVSINFIGIVNVNIPGETKRNMGGLMAYENNLGYYNGYSPNYMGSGVNAISGFWKYTNASNHQILGNLTIRDVSDSYKYYLSGPISFNSKALSTIKNSNYVRTYDLKGEQFGSIWFNGSNLTYEASFNLISFFNCLPLISSGRAILKDSNLNLEGVFDYKSGIFSGGTHNQKYCLLVPNDFLIGGSDPSNQQNKVDLTITPTLVTGSIDNNIIYINNNFYVYFSGIFVPAISDSNGNQFDSTGNTAYTSLNANIRKFCSNNNSPINAKTKNYDNVVLAYNASTQLWKYTSGL